MKTTAAIGGIRLTVELDAAEVARIARLFEGREDEKLRDALSALDNAVHDQLFAALNLMKKSGIEVAR